MNLFSQNPPAGNYLYHIFPLQYIIFLKNCRFFFYHINDNSGVELRYTARMQKKKPFILGLTGNIAAGKSVVQNMLANLGAFPLDADKIAHELYLPGQPAWQAILERFGADLCLPDGQIDRAKLGNLIFGHPDLQQELEAIVHPRVSLRIRALIEVSSADWVVVEAIKLFESDLRALCDCVWTVYAEDSLRLDRLINARSLSLEQARQRLEAQSPQEEKMRLADTCINSGGSFEQTWQQVKLGLEGLALAPVRLQKRGSCGFAPLGGVDLAMAENFFTSREELFAGLGHEELYLAFEGAQGRALLHWKRIGKLGLCTELQRLPLENGLHCALLRAWRKFALRTCSVLILPRRLLPGGRIPVASAPELLAQLHPVIVEQVLRASGEDLDDLVFCGSVDQGGGTA